MDRIGMLRQFLAENPNDAFTRYGLAMELSKLGEVEASLQEFGTLHQNHPDYTPGYFMAAQTLAAAGRIEEAKERLQLGIASAERTNNGHARMEMQAMLEDLGG